MISVLDIIKNSFIDLLSAFCNTMITMPVLIAVSGHGIHMKQQALNNGFVDYYEKPLKVQDIEEIITRYLQ